MIRSDLIENVPFKNEILSLGSAVAVVATCALALFVENERVLVRKWKVSDLMSDSRAGFGS